MNPEEMIERRIAITDEWTDRLGDLDGLVEDAQSVDMSVDDLLTSIVAEVKARLG